MPRHNGTTRKPNRPTRRRQLARDERRERKGDHEQDTRPNVCRMPSHIVDRTLAPRPGDHPAGF